MKRNIRTLAACVLLALAPAAYAQTPAELETQIRLIDATAANRGQTLVADKIASSFTRLAGSEENSVALVRALREGSSVQITTTATTPPPSGSTAPPTTTTTTTTFTPATGRMGWGNVRIALGLAQDSLLRAGITDPTAEQLQAALNGGDITLANGETMTLTGVLQMRADGMGWGQIAQAGGTKLGPVVSSLKSTRSQLARLPAAGTGGEATTTAATTTRPTGKSAVSTASGKGLTTAGGGAGKGRGVSTAEGSSTTTAGKGASRGITTAAGGSATTTTRGPSRGITTASGATSTASSRGLVTAEGAGAGQAARGNAYGRGIVSASGGGATTTAATSHGRGHGAGGAGLVTAGGGSAGSVTTAAGGGRGNGPNNDKGGGNGRGRGGGG